MSNSCNVARFLPTHAAAHPDQSALRIPVRRGRDWTFEDFSFAQTEDWVGRSAAGLQAAGILTGQRVLLMARPGPDLIVAAFALFRLGAVPVVIDPGMGLRSFLRCVRQSAPEALLGIGLALVIRRFFPSTFRSVERAVAVSNLARYRTGTDITPIAPVHRQADDPAAILFTSGSTGPAKGVLYTHGMFQAQLNLVRDSFEIQAGEIDFPMLPVFALFNPALGMTTVVPPINPSRPARANATDLLAVIRLAGVTNSFGSPVLWQKIADACAAESNSLGLPSLRRVLAAGAALPPTLVRQLKPFLPNGEIFSPYGATESLPISFISGREILQETAEKTESGAGICLGTPIPGVSVRIIEAAPGRELDESGMRILPAGEIGEIIVSGPNVTRHYDQNPEATRLAKIGGGDRFWHRLGDVGYFGEDGRLWFCGRLAECVVCPSGTFYPEMCEQIANTHPAVYRSALIPLGQPARPALVIQPKKGCWPSCRSARASMVTVLLEQLQRFPATRPIRDILFMRNFPVDIRHNAKIHRRQIARYFAKF